MRIASIDIGTNTILLLIAEVDENGVIHPLEHRQQIPRIGKDVDKNKIINSAAFARTAQILNDYKKIAFEYKVDSIIACATSAVRDADNRNQLLAYLNEATGIKVEVLSGEEEAYISFTGVLSGYNELVSSACVIDVGGGSTEVSYLKDEQIVMNSFRIGAVRLKERHFRHNRTTVHEISEAKSAINQAIDKDVRSGVNARTIIGVGGTATTLACIDQGLKEFEVSKVNGYCLTIDKIENWFNKLIMMPVAEIFSLSNATHGREDILAAGVLILSEFMKKSDIDNMIVSERGLRYGLVLREWKHRMKF